MAVEAVGAVDLDVVALVRRQRNRGAQVASGVHGEHLGVLAGRCTCGAGAAVEYGAGPTTVGQLQGCVVGSDSHDDGEVIGQWPGAANPGFLPGNTLLRRRDGDDVGMSVAVRWLVAGGVR